MEQPAIVLSRLHFSCLIFFCLLTCEIPMTLYVLQDVRSAADQLLAAGPGKIMKPPSTLHRIVVCVYLFCVS